MRTAQRRRDIVAQLYSAGYAEVKELAASLGVNDSTIRRDLAALARDGHVQRTHGGARPEIGAVDVPYVIKQREHQTAKKVIAAEACTLVQDGDRVMLDAGSTTFELAGQLRNRRDLTIVTNDVRIASAVADYPGVRLLVAGGELLPSTYTLFGDRAVEFLKNLSVDWTFLGADAIDIGSGITNTNTLEIPLKRMMLAVAHTSVVVVDSSKFGQRALARVADITEVDHIITDEQLDEDNAAAYGDRLERVSITSS